MAVEAFVNFNGQAAEAVEFYAKVFGLEVPKMMRYSDAPPDPENPVAESDKDFVMYASLPIAGSMVMFSDCPTVWQAKFGNNISLTVATTSKDDIQKWFTAMAEGGEIMMPLEETFWSQLFGMVTDKFGIPWQFSHDDGRTF